MKDSTRLRRMREAAFPVATPNRTAAAARPSRRDLQAALDASLQLQAHYARLLNMHDGGHRRIFNSADEWISRLRELTRLAADRTKTPDSHPKGFVV